VLNGSGVTGQAAEAAEALGAAGFDVVGAGDAEAFAGGATVVRFAPGKQAEADLVRRWLVAGAQLQEADSAADVDVEVVTGTDWAGVRAEPAPPGDGAPATTATTAPATTATTAPATTLPPEVVPQPPPDAAPCG
jgi:hypothetical protein